LGELSFIEQKKDRLFFEWKMKDKFLSSDNLSRFTSEPLIVLYSTDITGVGVEVKNWRNIKKYFSGVLKKIEQSEDLNKWTKKLARALYRDKGVLAGIVARDVEALHQVYSINLKNDNDTLSYSENSYNILSEDPIKTDVTEFVELKDETANQVTYRKTKKYNEASTYNAVMNLLSLYSPADQQEELDEIASKSTFDVSKQYSYKYNYQSHLPVSISVEEKNIMDVGKRNSLKIKKRIINSK